MTPEQMQRLAQEAESFNRHLMSVHARLRHLRITETRGSASVTLNGLGEICDVSIEWVDQEVQDCLLAALRAAEGRAQAGYEMFGGGRG